MSGNNFLITLESISKAYLSDAGLKINILEDISFEIPAAEKGVITSILAPFGSGKSTLLKIISGTTEQSGGTIRLNKTGNRIIPMIPEKPSSFPWMNVKQNIEFGLNLSENKKYNVTELISMVGLSGYDEHFPNNKSTGFRFRISLARALALNPQFILIDDSFKLMNKERKEEIYKLLLNISNSEKQNFILATTNLIEAVQLSDFIFLMSNKPGKIIRIIENKREHSTGLLDYRSEKFTSLKKEIEEVFKSLNTLSTINYSV